MTTIIANPDNLLCGVWRALEKDSDDYYRSEYKISVEDGQFQVFAIDQSDGEEFEISDITWNGVTLGFYSYVPSTGRCGINQMRYVGDGKIEFLFTFTEREIWTRYNQAEQGADGKPPSADQPPHELKPNTRLP